MSSTPAQGPAPTADQTPLPAAPDNRQLTVKRVTLRSLFNQQKPEMAKLLPRGMDAERLFRMALTECIKNPQLLECTAESWALAIQTCAQQGLYPDSGLGYMYLVPRKNRKAGTIEVKAMRGYQGDIKLARNTGEIADIYAEVVHAKDEYKVTKGLNRDIVHVPYEGDDDPGALKACYAVAKLVSGEVAFVTLAKRDVERHRASSESWQEEWSPWQKHTAAMWKKTAVHELVKWLPKSSEAMERVARTIAGETTIDTTPIEATSVPMAPKSGLEGLTARLQEEGGGATGVAGAQETGEGAGAPGCTHPNLPPSKVAALEPGKVAVCPDCGEELKNDAPAPSREPGSDDDTPTPREAVEALAGAAATQQGSGPRRSEPTRVGAVGRQKRLEE